MTIPSPDTVKTFEACHWASLGRRDVLWSTYYISRQLLDQNIEGDLVECGVFSGTHPAMMARAIIDHNNIGDTRKIHLFDSFNGIPSISCHDQFTPKQEADLRRGTTCPRCLTETYVKDWGIPESMLVYHEGLFKDTMPGLSFPIALLRIDCDLYESTVQVLEYLWPLVVEKGVCVLDDYSFQGCREAFLNINPGTISPLMWQRR